MSAHWHGEDEHMTPDEFEQHLIDSHNIDAGIAGADTRASLRWHWREHGAERLLYVDRPWGQSISALSEDS